MSLMITLAIMAVAALILVVTLVLERRGWMQARVRMVPLVPLQFLALLVLIAMIGHVISLLTGTPFVGRAGL